MPLLVAKILNSTPCVRWLSCALIGDLLEWKISRETNQLREKVAPASEAVARTAGSFPASVEKTPARGSLWLT
jgi:hypothetical protein